MTEGRPEDEAAPDQATSDDTTSDGDAQPDDVTPVPADDATTPDEDAPSDEGASSDEDAPSDEEAPGDPAPAVDEPAAGPDASAPDADEPDVDEPDADGAVAGTEAERGARPTPDEDPAGAVDDAPTEVLAGPAVVSRTSVLGGRGEPPAPAESAQPAEPTAPTEPAAPAEPTRTEPGGTERAGGSPIDVFPDEPRERRWPRAVGLIAAGAVVLAGAYVGALWLLSDRVPPGTTVAGVDVGGLERDVAVDRLEEALADARTEPVPVAAGESRTTFDPVAAGLDIDVAATVDSVTGFGLEPIRLWQQVFGAGAVEPVSTLADEETFTEEVAATAEALATEPVDGTVVFVDGAADTTAAQDGVAVDVEGATDILRTEWLTAPRPIELPTELVEPAITDAEVDRALREVARPLASAPVVVAVEDERVELPSDVVTAAASFVPEEDRLELVLAGEVLVEAVLDRTEGLLDEPSDARFVFADGAPVIEPGVAGTTLDPEQLAQAVAEAGTGDDRTARVELVERTPEVTTEDLEELGVVEVVSEFDTPLTSEPRRTQNIRAGSAAINGTLVRPDEVFSLTEALGPIDAAHGYVQAGAIVNGRHSDAWGGGLSQVSTTVYNAAFFAGFEDVEHQPHSEWFRRYPEGREATIFTGVIDLKWRNNTPYGALVQAWVADGSAHVRIWGTKYWTVESSTSGRYNVQQPTTRYDTSSECSPQSAGNPGFGVTVTRRLLLDGEVEHEEEWSHQYRPQNRIVCGPPPGDDDEDDEDD